MPGGASSGHRVGWDQVFVRSSGAHLWDETGREYLDFLCAWGPIVLGHSDRRVNEAVLAATNTCDLTGVGPQLGEVQLAETVCSLLPSAQKVAFCTSGTDAAMHAAHVARALTGRRKLLKFHGSYHGWSDHLAVGCARNGVTADTPLGSPNGGGLHPQMLADIVVVEWNDFAGLEAAFAEHGDSLAAVFAEGYIHSFGCVPAAPGFLERIRALCDRQGTVFVMDEVKTGFRSALGGYQSICGVTPDLTIFGKSIANGYSLAGMAGSDEAMRYVGAYDTQHATVDGTYNASPYAIAAANKTLEIMRTEDVVNRLYALGDRLRSKIQAAIDDTGAQAVVTGLGSQWAVYFTDEAPRNFRQALRSDTRRYSAYQSTLLAGGVLETVATASDRRLCAATTEEDIDRVAEVYHAAMAATVS